ncbi:HlyD family type I secretion periplasmic adaptor subunit [Sesbania bispinosa]|nr:HlyD family type I secretion periplasmic adaptor subunit [Sesbania bispinosa]
MGLVGYGRLGRNRVVVLLEIKLSWAMDFVKALLNKFEPVIDPDNWVQEEGFRILAPGKQRERDQFLSDSQTNNAV